MITTLLMTLSLLIYPSEPQEVLISIDQKIEKVEIYYIEDDVLYETLVPVFAENTPILQLVMYKDYQIVINDNILITMTVNAYEIVDMRDIDISFDGEYDMHQGIIFFKNQELSWKH